MAEEGDAASPPLSGEGGGAIAGANGAATAAPMSPVAVGTGATGAVAKRAVRAPLPQRKVLMVKKRNGGLEAVSFDKVLRRLRKLASFPTNLDASVNTDDLALRVIERIFEGVETEKLDELAANICSSRIADHPHWGTLAARILVDNHTKNTSQSFSETVAQLYAHVDVHGKPCPLVSQKLHDLTMKNMKKLNSHINNGYHRDLLLDYFGISTLLNGSYLMRINGRVVERPAHMFMRVALGIHGDDIKAALETYDLMSTKRFIHASPTLFSAGSPTPQLSSCFVAGTRVFTLNAGAKAIEDVAIGDLVVTHLGRAKPVVQTHANPLGGRALFDFKVFKGPTVTATEDHKFMGLTKDQLSWEPPERQEPRWTALGALRVGDYIEIPRYEGSEDGAAQLTLSVAEGPAWAVSEAFCVLLGEWLANGQLVPDGIAFRIPGDGTGDGIEDEKRKFLVVAGVAGFGKGVSVSVLPHLDEDRVERHAAQDMLLVFESATMRRDVVALFGEPGALRLPPAVLAWPTRLVRALLVGFGGVNLYRPSPDVKESIGEAKDAALHADVFNLVRSRGIVHHDKWSQGVKTVGGRTFLRIESKVPSARLGSADVATVYTLGVEDDHSYAVEGLIARNCYLVANKEDSIKGIYATLSEMAQISKHAGGIGVHVSDVRAKGSAIRGTNGIADGIVPMLRLFNDTALYVNQGGGKRPGAIAVYLEPWHADVVSFLGLRKTTGDMKQRCLDLFLALWCPDLLVKRVIADGEWSLMCPDECPGLPDVWGPAFEALYERYEAEGRARSKMKARDLWTAICLAQAETGVPYLLYKDHVNAKCNQSNLGTIKSSNLCCEVTIYSSPDESGVCNLASLALPSYVVRDASGHATGFDFAELRRVVGVVTRNLNKVIDVNFYPVEPARLSNMRHRPLGIGVQGLANVFMALRLPYDSSEAADLNRRIFATLYYGALEASCALAERDGTYESWAGSPASRGKLQFDLWTDPETKGPVVPDPVAAVGDPAHLDWAALKARIATHGLRNSLLVAPMPTASTSNILGCVESFEPITSMAFTRRTLAGEFTIVCKELVEELIELGVWDAGMKEAILRNEGSVQGLARVPPWLQAVYKTAWEISNRTMIDMAAARGPYICQSASQNVFMADAGHNIEKLFNSHLYAWKMGLKTASYYVRTRPQSRIQSFTLAPERPTSSKATIAEASDAGGPAAPATPARVPLACARDNPYCESCSG